jgi:hypothetical protein
VIVVAVKYFRWDTAGERFAPGRVREINEVLASAASGAYRVTEIVWIERHRFFLYSSIALERNLSS